MDNVGAIIAISIYFISGMVLLFLVQKPVAMLHAKEPKEFERAIGNAFSILTWKAIPFAYYLASNEFKKNIVFQEIIQQFILPMWVARVQLISLAAFCVLLFNQSS